MKQDEYNTKMKRMEKHVQDITAKEISNRECRGKYRWKSAIKCCGTWGTTT